MSDDKIKIRKKENILGFTSFGYYSCYILNKVIFLTSIDGSIVILSLTNLKEYPNHN